MLDVGNVASAHGRIAASGSRTARSNMGEPLGCCEAASPLPGGNAFDESQLTRRLSFSNWSMDSCRTRPRSEPAA